MRHCAPVGGLEDIRKAYNFYTGIFHPEDFEHLSECRPEL